MTTEVESYFAVMREGGHGVYSSPSYAIEGLFGLVGEKLFEGHEGELDFVEKMKQKFPVALFENEQLCRDIRLYGEEGGVTVAFKNEALYTRMPVENEKISCPQAHCLCIDHMELPQVTVVECPHLEIIKLASDLALSIEVGQQSVASDYLEYMPIDVGDANGSRIKLPFAPLLSDVQKMAGAMREIYSEEVPRPEVDRRLILDSSNMEPSTRQQYSMEVLPVYEELTEEFCGKRKFMFDQLKMRGFSFDGVTESFGNGGYCWNMKDPTGVQVCLAENGSYRISKRVKTLETQNLSIYTAGQDVMSGRPIVYKEVDQSNLTTGIILLRAVK